MDHEHLRAYGPRLPDQQFADAVQAAAVDLSVFSAAPGRKLVFMSMVTHSVLKGPSPYTTLFLASMARLTYSDAAGAAHTLDEHLLVGCLTPAAEIACKDHSGKHHCLLETGAANTQSQQQVQSLEAELESAAIKAGGSSREKPPQSDFAYNSQDWRALGFIKVQYILDVITLGYEIMFLDTDILMLKNPLPYIVSMDAQVVGSVQDCEWTDDRVSQSSPPNFNIGILYFRSDGATARLVQSWITLMHNIVLGEPNFGSLWDQRAFNAVAADFSRSLRMTLKAFSPELFHNACYHACACMLTPSPQDGRPFLDNTLRNNVTRDGGTVPGHVTLGKIRVATRNAEGVALTSAGLIPWLDASSMTCPAGILEEHILMHFPCITHANEKFEQMVNMAKQMQNA